MATAPDTAAVEAYRALAAALRDWDGSLAGAEELRARARSLPLLRGRPEDPAGAVLQLVRSAYDRPVTAGRFLAATRDPQRRLLVAPFLGDPDLVDESGWPFDDVLHVPDQVAVEWAEAVCALAPVDERVRGFALELFRARRRQVWVPVSRALVELALRDPVTLERLLGHRERCFPGGLPEKWSGSLLGHRSVQRKGAEARPGAGAGALPPNARGDDSHLARHLLHFGCSFVARGGPPERFPEFADGRFAAMKLPSDPSDASAVLLALQALLDGPEPIRRGVLAALPARFGEVPPDDQAEEAIRAIVERLEGVPGADPAVAAARNRLLQPRWREPLSEGRRIDLVWSWGQTARWLVARGDRAAYAEMLAAAPECVDFLRLAVEGSFPGGAPTAVEALAPRLPVVLDADLRATTEPVSRAVTTVEVCWLLFERPEVAGWPWKSLVARLCGAATAGAEPPGTVETVARARMAIALGRPIAGRAPEIPKFLLRDATLDPDVVLELARSQSGSVAIQVAVQIERLLREQARSIPRSAGAAPGAISAEAHAAQVRFLWRLPRADPPAELFRQLATMLRGEETPVHHLVERLRTLDERREVAASDPDPLLDAFRALAETVASHVEGADGAPAEKLRNLVKHTRELQAKTARGGFQPAALGTWLGDRDGRGGLTAWLDWLGGFEKPPAAVWSRLAGAFQEVEGTGAPDLDRLQEAEEAIRAFFDALETVPWPERAIVDWQRREAETWLARKRAESAVRRAEAARIAALLEAPEEAEIETYLARPPEELAEVPADSLRALHAFLLDHLMLVRAQRLRRKVRGRVELRSASAHLAPLVGGVAGGVLLVVDMGKDWFEVLRGGCSVGFWATLLISVVGAFVLFVGILPARLLPEPDPARRRWGPVLRRLGRATAVFAFAWALAALTTGLAMWTLEGTAARLFENGEPIPFVPHLALWSGLSLFFGIAFNLLLQGRGFSRQG